MYIVNIGSPLVDPSKEELEGMMNTIERNKDVTRILFTSSDDNSDQCGEVSNITLKQIDTNTWQPIGNVKLVGCIGDLLKQCLDKPDEIVERIVFARCGTLLPSGEFITEAIKSVYVLSDASHLKFPFLHKSMDN